MLEGHQAWGHVRSTVQRVREQKEEAWADEVLPSSTSSARKGPGRAGMTGASMKARGPGQDLGSVPWGMGSGTPKISGIGGAPIHCANGETPELPLNPFFPKHHLPCDSVNQEVFIEPEERTPILERLMENRGGCL